MDWRIRHVFNFSPQKSWEKGFCHTGFHGIRGAQYLVQPAENWVGRLIPGDRFIWTAGAVDRGLSRNHIRVDLHNPRYISELPDGSLVVSCRASNQVYRLYPVDRTVELFIDCGRLGMKDLGSCEYDLQGSIWVNEVEGCRIWRFTPEGRVIQTLGSGEPGFQAETASFEAARFDRVSDLRLGPDGSLYALEGGSCCVRRIDLEQKTVERIAGSGQPGFSGDGGPAAQASFGGVPGDPRKGPRALALDEAGNVYVGDTLNHVVRLVKRDGGVVSTIAGKRQVEPGLRNSAFKTDPLSLNLPAISSLDYYDGCLYISDESGDLVVLEKSVR